MAILHRCCCCSIRRGSIIIGFYTLIGYIVTLAIFNYRILERATTAQFVLICLFTGCRVLSAVACVVMLIGLYVESHKLLIPWLIMEPITTIMGTIVAFEVLDTQEEFNFVLVAVIMAAGVALDIYFVLCVFSQYQEYSALCNYSSAEPNEMQEQNSAKAEEGPESKEVP